MDIEFKITMALENKNPQILNNPYNENYIS